MLQLSGAWLCGLYSVPQGADLSRLRSSDLKVTGGTGWLAKAIADNSLVAVTDGSYIKEHYPGLCAAAFVLECTKGWSDWPEHLQRHQRWQMRIEGNSWN